MFASPGRAGYGAGMRIAMLLVLLVGCKADGGDYPITTGGDDHPINPMVDGRPADGVIGDGGTMITGRVCVITDLRSPATGCKASGAANITVQLGTETAMTADDGSFMLVPPIATGLVWRTRGTDLVDSVVPLTTSFILPMVSVQTYLDLQNSNSVIVNSGQGSVFVYVRKTGVALAGATTVTAPLPTFASLGDRTTATNWVQGETGPLGVSWTAGITAGTASLVITPPGQEVTAGQVIVPVEDGAITYATLAFP